MSDTEMVDDAPVENGQPENDQTSANETEADNTGEEEQGAQPEPEKVEGEGTEGEQKPEYSEEEKQEYAGKAQAAINRLTGKLRTSQERETALMKEIETLKAQINPPSDSEKAPSLDDYDSIDEYITAAIAHGVKAVQQPQNGQEQTQEQPQFDEQTQQAFESFRANEQAVAKKHPDYQEKVQAFVGSIDVQNPELSVALAPFVIESPKGSEILYKLATDPSLQIELMSMSVPRAMAKIVQMEDSLNQKPQKKVPANPPPNPVEATGANTNDSELSGRELRKRAGLI